jgi:hypothetical protein
VLNPPDRDPLALTTARTASVVGAVVFVVCLGAALLLIGGSLIASASSPADAVTTTDKVTEAAASPDITTTISRTRETTTVTARSARGLLEQVAIPPVVALLQLGFALLVAFVVAGVAQRVLLGRYAFTLGPLTVPEVPERAVAKPGDAAITGLEAVVSDKGREQAEAAAGTSRATTGFTVPESASVLTSDPNLALAGLRIEIERRLRWIAEAAGVESRSSSAGSLTRALQAAGVLPPDVASALYDLIGVGNQAVHAFDVSPGAAEWARTEGPRLLALLDALYEDVRNG